MAQASLQAEAVAALREAKGHLAAGRDREAMAICERVLSQDAGNVEARHLRGLMALRAGRLDQALDDLEAFVAAVPDSVDGRLRLGDVLRRLGRLEEATRCLEQATALMPEGATAHYHLGLVHQDAGRAGAAKVCLTRALLLDPRHAAARNALGNLLAARGRHDEAIFCYEAAIACAPESPAAYGNLACLLVVLDRRTEARQLLERALTVAPTDPASHYNLANLRRLEGDLEDAVTSYRRALDLAPAMAEAHCNLGNALDELGRTEEALAALAQAAAQAPNDARFVYNLGNTLLAAGRAAEAVAPLERAIALDPGLVAARVALGNALFAERRLEEATRHLVEARAIDPSCPGVDYNLANVLARAGRLDEALAAYDRALAAEPRNPAVHNNRGVALAELGELDRAEASYRRALALAPDHGDAWNNLGLVLVAQGRLVEAEAAYARALELVPDSPGLHVNLGNLRREQGRGEAAADHCRRAILRDPGFAKAHYNLGHVLRDQARIEDAAAAFERALRLDAAFEDALAQLLLCLYQLCAWDRLPPFLEQLEAATRSALAAGRRPGETPFLAMLRSDDPALHAAVAEAWSGAIARRMDGTRLPPRPHDTHPRLRIGYLSGDFGDHPVTHLTTTLLPAHDRTRFEVTAYAYGPDDPGPHRAGIRAACEHFVDLGALSHIEAARRIREDGIDILVDLTGPMADHRQEIAALRPAPVQAAYLGFLGSIGGGIVDYAITDAITTPPDVAHHFREALVLLPGCLMVSGDLRHRPPPVAFEETGLPADGFVFCCFSTSYKIDAELFAVWMRLLRRIEGSVLWLLGGAAERQLRLAAEARGIDPGRLIFAPRVAYAHHLGRLALADLALDTRRYGGGTTACNALAAGVPLVAITGRHPVARMSTSILRAAGLPELATVDLDAYERLALRLALDESALVALRERLLAGRAALPLFDAPGGARRLEAAYEAMWARYTRGDPPATIAVPPFEPAPRPAAD